MLRTERGLTYGAQANMDTLKDSGDFEAETNTRSEATGEVLRLIVDEFWRLQRERVGERELADAKAYLTGSFPLTIETPECDRDAGGQRAVLRAAARAAAEFPRTRQRRHGRRHPARGARAAPTRSAVDCPGRQRIGVRRRSCAVSASARVETVELGDLDLTAANFKRAKTAGAGAGGAGGGQGVGRVGADGRSAAL